ncbi:hypothetical protein GF312_20415 [Candidatus Poribacteria bacterium]|nr:hypothetical protein [Candidatus Poribacteria bacterium]
MKKALSIVWLPVIVLFIIPFNAAAEPMVAWNQSDDIEALNFNFENTLGEPFPLELPGIEPIYVTEVNIQTGGSEIAIATESLDFFYYGEYEGGTIFATYIGEDGYYVLPITLHSATLAEHYKIDELPELPEDLLTLPAPEEVDMYFDATISVLGSEPFGFRLVLWKGIPIMGGVY